MIISSWNVNSVRARIENIKEYLKKFSPDILMMQEIKTPNETYPYEDIKSLKYENYVFGQKSYNGVAIISKKKLSNIKNDIFKEQIARYEFAKTSGRETIFTAFEPPTPRCEPSKQLHSTLNDLQGTQWEINLDFLSCIFDIELNDKNRTILPHGGWKDKTYRIKKIKVKSEFETVFTP